MARNQEKAQAMLNRFLKAKQEANAKVPLKRPKMASEVTNLNEAERWRQQIIRQIAKEVSIIQDGSMGEHKIRERNDYINRLLREKRHYDRQIRALGGADYSLGPRVADGDGTIAIGLDGYYYFGAARNLPGVRELFEKKETVDKPATRYELTQKIDADYYGYRDDDDGLLEKLEAAAERKEIQSAVEQWQKENKDRARAESAHDALLIAADPESGTLFRAHVPLPSQEDIEKRLFEHRKKLLLEKLNSPQS